MLKCKTIYMKIVNKSKDLAALHLAIILVSVRTYGVNNLNLSLL